MKATLAILTIGVVPVSEVLPLLTEHVSEQQITHLSLLGKMSREEVMEDYAVEAGGGAPGTVFREGKKGPVFRPKNEGRPQGGVEEVAKQGYEGVFFF